jgi:CheY-like chemotaxis protein
MTPRWAAYPLSTRIDCSHGSVRHWARVDGSPATVLIVVYDAWLRWQLSEAIGTAGYAVVQASNGASGLRFANRHRCDLILVASRLPELSGVSLVEAFREMPGTRHTPIVLVDQVECSPLAEACRQLRFKLDDRFFATPSVSPRSQAVSSLDAPLRGDRPAGARRSRRTAWKAASPAPPINPDAFTAEELAHAVRARRD